MQHASISRTRYMQENRKMRFQKAFDGWSGQDSRGVFFLLILSLWIALRMALVGAKLSPVVAVQQVVG